MTSTQSAVAREAALSASGFGPILGTLQSVGQALSKVLGGGRKNLISPFSKNNPLGGSPRNNEMKRKPARDAVIRAEQWFNRLVTRPGDSEAFARFVEQALIVREEAPAWYASMLPEVRDALEGALSEPTPVDTMAPLIAPEPVYEIARPVVSQLQYFAGTTGADSNRALAAIETGGYSLPTKVLPRPRPEIVPGIPSNVGSAFNVATDPSALPETRRTDGALFLIIALAALAVLR